MNPNQYQKKKELPMVIKLLIALVLGVIFAVITAAVVIINNMYLSGTLAVVFAIGIDAKINWSKLEKRFR